MSKNNTDEQIAPESTEESASTDSTETSETSPESASPVLPVPTVKSVVSALYGTTDKDGMSGEYGKRAESGFDRLTAKDRNAVKDAVKTRMDRFMSLGPAGFDRAAAVWTVLSSLDAPVRSAKVVTVETVTAQMSEKVAMLRFAADAIFAGSVPVAGFDGLVPILEESDIPELSAEQCETALNRYASVGTGSKSKEHDIADLVAETYADWTPGTYRTIGEILAAIASNHPELGVDNKWGGRVNASLFGKKAAEKYETYITPVSANSPEAHEADTKDGSGRAGAIRTDAAYPPESDTE